MEIRRADDLVDIAKLGLALAEAKLLLAGRCCMDQQLSPERLLSDVSKIPSA